MSACARALRTLGMLRWILVVQGSYPKGAIVSRQVIYIPSQMVRTYVERADDMNLRLLWVLEHALVPQILEDSDRGKLVRQGLATVRFDDTDFKSEYKSWMSAWEFATDPQCTPEKVRAILRPCESVMGAAMREAEAEVAKSHERLKSYWEDRSGERRGWCPIL